MIKKCFICEQTNPMFIWSSSRHFPRHLIAKSDKMLELVLESGVPICLKCRKKLDGVVE